NPDPLHSDHHWWNSGIFSTYHRAKLACQPISLARGSTFRTNVSLFDYTIRTLYSGNHSIDRVQYLGNSLGNCDVAEVSLKWDYLQRTARVVVRYHFRI